MPATMSSISDNTIANSTAATPRGGEGRRSRCSFIALAVQLDVGSRDGLDQARKFHFDLLRPGRVGHLLHEEPPDPEHRQVLAARTRTADSRAVDDQEIQHPAVAKAGIPRGQKPLPAGLVIRRRLRESGTWRRGIAVVEKCRTRGSVVHQRRICRGGREWNAYVWRYGCVGGVGRAIRPKRAVFGER